MTWQALRRLVLGLALLLSLVAGSVSVGAAAPSIPPTFGTSEYPLPGCQTKYLGFTGVIDPVGMPTGTYVFFSSIGPKGEISFTQSVAAFAYACIPQGAYFATGLNGS